MSDLIPDIDFASKCETVSVTFSFERAIRYVMVFSDPGTIIEMYLLRSEGAHKNAH